MANGKQTTLYLGQSTLKGRITQTALTQEGFTSSFTAVIFDAFTGDSRTLDTSGPFIFTMDPQNKKNQGIEEMIPGSWSVSSGTYTFTNTLRGVNLDAHDDAGAYARAKEWPVGTEFAITTSPQNQNYLQGLLDGTFRFRNSMNFGVDQNFMGKVQFVFTPAYLTCGSSPTTTAATWAAVTDGEFAVTIDGTARDITGIDFTNVGNNDQVAATIQTAIRAVTSGTEEVEWDGTQFIIRSGDVTTSSAITVLSAVSGGSGTDISGAGATTYLDGETGQGTVTAASMGRLRSGVVQDDTELANLVDIEDGDEVYHVADGKKYDRIAGSWVARESGGTFANASTTVAGKVEIATAAEFDAGTDTGGTGAPLVVAPSTFGVTSTELAQLSGTTNIAEADTFFGATDVTGAEMETLTARGNAGGLHVHGPDTGVITKEVYRLTDTETLTFTSVTESDLGSSLKFDTPSTNNQGGGRSLAFNSGLTATSVHDKNPSFVCPVDFQGTTTQDAFIGFVNSTFAATSLEDSVMTLDHCGFVIQDGTIYGSCADGSTQQKTSALGTTLTNENDYGLTFDGTTVTFYVNGSSVGTLNTNVPDDNLKQFAVSIVADASATTVALSLKKTTTIMIDAI